MNIKILVGYHKPDFLIKNDIYIPIHLGRSLKNEELKDYSIGENCNDFMLKNMIGDDIGDNISHLNKYFNELTGIYWAWKNYDKLGNPDYIGYVHYRRFLLFDQNNVSYPKAPNNYDLVCNFANEIFLNSIEPRDYVQQYDMIIPKPLESTLVNCDFKDLRELNLSYNFSDYGLKLLEKIILSSEYRNLYSDIVKEFYKRTSYYPANIFIMKKELFFDFCEFRFNIAFKMFEIMEKRLINSSIHGSREMGWALEHLMSFYVAFLKNKNYKIKELPIVILKNTQVDILKKKYLVSDKDIVIVFCVDESSFPLLSVNINSILENATFLEKYTISILHLNINRDRLDSLLKNFEDKISIEFHNIQYIYDEFFGLKFRISFFEYIKFWIPEIFSNYKQVFYLDINVLILNDLLNLGKIYSKNPLYGIQDISLSVDFYKNICFSKDINLENLEEYDFINTNFLIYNIDKIKINDFKSKCVKILENNAEEFFTKIDKNFISFFKDCFFHHAASFIYNFVFQELSFISFKDGQQVINNIQKSQFIYIPRSIKSKIDNISNPHYFLIYTKYTTPWNFPYIEQHKFWWDYCRKSQFYEEILRKNPLYSIPIFGAVKKIKNHLSYRLGRLFFDTRSFLQILFFPIRFFMTLVDFKVSNINDIYNLSLECYADYEEAMEIKNSIYYIFGSLVLKHPFTFLLKWRQLKSNLKKEFEWKN